MKKVILILSMIALYSHELNAQNILKGNVEDALTHTPILGASVYINNSTIGVSTKKDGSFLLSVPDGIFEVIVSAVGYSTYSLRIGNAFNYNSSLLVSLEESAILLNEIQVIDKKSKEWHKMLEIFKESFIGTSPFAKFCYIQNENDIYFVGESADSFSVKSKQPIILINDALGYQLECLLVLYDFSNKGNDYMYSVKTRFIDISTDKEIVDVRNNAYEGSQYHFFLTLIKNEVANSNFRISIVPAVFYNLNAGDTDDSIIKKEFDASRNIYSLFWSDYLKVFHKVKKTTSWLKLNNSAAYFDKSSRLINPFGVTVYGDWAYDGFARALPINFSPN